MLRKLIAGVTILPLLLTVLAFTGCEKQSAQPTTGEAVEQGARTGQPGPNPAARRRIQQLQQEEGPAEETP
jgi:hypothetical protein